jgi:hypothetical protein
MANNLLGYDLAPHKWPRSWGERPTTMAFDQRPRGSMTPVRRYARDDNSVINPDEEPEKGDVAPMLVHLLKTRLDPGDVEVALELLRRLAPDAVGTGASFFPAERSPSTAHDSLRADVAAARRQRTARMMQADRELAAEFGEDYTRLQRHRIW